MAPPVPPVSEEKDVRRDVALTKEMEEKLKRELLEYGNGLLKPSDSVEELLRKLDKLEHLLQHLLQDRKPLIEMALKPAEEALISNALLRHDEVDVRITVISCISEIIRITAPDEPYNEDQMKDYFKLVNTAYRKLPSMAGRTYTRAVSIIQTVSCCQICVRMLDFELHSTILEMFHLFLDGIQLSHPQEIFSSMEHIMTLMIQDIEESDALMVELTKIFLAALKKGNENISPCAFQLAKKVFEKCAGSMQNFVPEAVRHMGDAVQEYDDVIVSSFLGATRSDDMEYDDVIISSCLGATQSDNMNVEQIGTHACDREQVNLAGDLILPSLEENYCIDNLKDVGNIDENRASVPYSYDHPNRQENVSLEAKGMGIESSYHKEVNLQDDENVNENHQKMSHLGDQINWQESDLERINSTSGPDGSTPCINNNNSDEMTNSGSLKEQNLKPLHASLTPLRQVSHMKDHDTRREEDPLEKQNSPDAIIPVNIEGAHREQQELKQDDFPILKKRSRKPNSIIKPEEGYDPLWMLCELASNEGSHHRKSSRKNVGFQKKNIISKLSKSSSSSVREPVNAELRPQKKFCPEKKDGTLDQDNGLYLLSTSVNNFSETVASKNIVDEECTKEKLEKSSEKHLLTCTTDGILKNPMKRKRSVMKPRKKVWSKNIVFEADTSKDLVKVKRLKEANNIDGIPKHLKRGLGTSNNADLAEKKLGNSVIDEDLSGDILIKTLVLQARNQSSQVESHSTEVSNPHYQREVTLPKEKTFYKKRQCSLAKKAPGETSKGKTAISGNQTGNIVVKTLAKTTSSEEKACSEDISCPKRQRSDIPYNEKNHSKRRTHSLAKKALGEKSKGKAVFSETEMGDIVIETMASQSKEKGHSQEAAITHASRLSYEEEASEVNHAKKRYHEDLIGCKIKVWWPLDEMYYEGKVTSFDHLKKTYQVDYDDGETEILDLTKERWEVITDDGLCSHELKIVKAAVVSRDCGSDSSRSSKRKLKGLCKQNLG